MFFGSSSSASRFSTPSHLKPSGFLALQKLTVHILLRCLLYPMTMRPKRLLPLLFQTLFPIVTSRFLIMSMAMRSLKSLLIGWTPIVQTWTSSSVEIFVVYKLVNSQPTAITLPLENDFVWYRILWTISSICAIFLKPYYIKPTNTLTSFFFIAEIILVTGWWLVKQMSLQMSSWTHFGSPTSICPPIALERSNRRLSLILESSHESKPHFYHQ